MAQRQNDLAMKPASAPLQKTQMSAKYRASRSEPFIAWSSRLKSTVVKDAARYEADIAWQIRFAKMKLYHGRDKKNYNWTPLTDMLKRAEAAQQDFG